MSSAMPPAAPDKPLQFDEAEYQNSGGVSPAAGAPEPGASLPGGAVCSACKEDLENVYYEANGSLLCPRCKEEIEKALAGGSAGRRLALAALLGGLTALAGSGVYYGIRTISGYEVALVAIALGWLIGGAIRKATAGRGGRVYQILAVVLTYISISFSYLPDMIMAFASGADAADASAAPVKTGTTASQPPLVPEPIRANEQDSKPEIRPESMVSRSDSGGQTGRQEETPLHAEAASAGDEDSDESNLALALVVVLAIVLSVPVLLVKESPILVLIYGFGLLQAWKMASKVQVTITGPFNLQSNSEPAALPPLPPS